MEKRSHHKVGRGSLYHNKETDAPWPVKAYFIRVALFTIELMALASWCLIIPFIDAKYVSGWGILWGKVQPLVVILGFGFASGALVLSNSPLAVPLSSFKNLLAWTSPPGLVWKILRASPLRPSAPRFFSRFLYLLMIGASVISWNFVPYFLRPWIAFSRDRLDRLVVYETIAIIPAAYLINRCLDQEKSLRSVAVFANAP
jgi:hypothetical protein